MAKEDRLAAIRAAAVKQNSTEEVIPLKTQPKGVKAQMIGGRTGWNPEAAMGGEVKVYTPSPSPSAKVDAILDKAKAARKRAMPVPKQASGNAAPKLRDTFVASRMTPPMDARTSAKPITVRTRREGKPLAEAFNRMPAVGKPRPNRAKAGFTPGGRGDMAYTGVKPKAPVAPRAPKARLSGGGKLAAASIMYNAGQAAYTEFKKKK